MIDEKINQQYTKKIKLFQKYNRYYYDLNDDLLTTREMIKGDCTITYLGGHNYEALEEDTIVYEFKTGPYLGLEKDKTFLFDNNLELS